MNPDQCLSNTLTIAALQTKEKLLQVGTSIDKKEYVKRKIILKNV